AASPVQIDGVRDGHEWALGRRALGDRVSGLTVPSVLIPHEERSAAGAVDDPWPELDPDPSVGKGQGHAPRLPCAEIRSPVYDDGVTGRVNARIRVLRRGRAKATIGAAERRRTAAHTRAASQDVDREVVRAAPSHY